eukprot:gnl/MRDRNA2_/MRDRNA2_87844_c0_seq1.p1 gnl/MRDRNA2_/MRDRNA2_87844_c0~~gnl/MRDRNA2_/MRDRNA2_87844_c0_seq1.p1  ORF type:complete len:283 (+),score=67.34 gnl/MRDRNA2_/MRDRNA2_87844_c0_seq1:82-930(+)
MSVSAYPAEAMKTEPMKIAYPVAKTFIQYPALRNPSLDAFFQERVISSCPASRMNSIEEDEEATSSPRSPIGVSTDVKHNANEWEYTVKNTFIDFPAWESLRNPSLEGFFHERVLKSCPASRAQSLDDSPCKALVSGAKEQVYQVEQQALRSISLEECLRDIEDKYQNLESYDDLLSTKANSDEDSAAATPGLLSDAEEEVKPRAISLTSGLGLWSVGSAQHHLGTCKPCAFLWKDANGCQNGASCIFCHMCPPGEVKQRKKQKLAMRKMVKQFRKAQMTGY